MEYRIVQVEDHSILGSDKKAADNLARTVNGAIREGWKPIGGVAATRIGSVVFLLQAMIKD